MKRFLTFVLAVILTSAVLEGCAQRDPGLDPHIRLTSSSSYAAAEWLEERLDVIPDRIVIGTDASRYGIDLSALEDDGYVIRDLGGEIALFARTDVGLDLAVRKYAKTVEKGARVADETYHEGYRIEKLTVAGNDISEYALSVEGDWEFLRNWVETYIFDTVTKLIRQACGVTLATEGALHHIIFRQVPETAKFGEGDYAYRVENGDVIIEYCRRLGAKNGAVMFLQKELGWDGLLYGDDVLAESDHIDIPEGRSVDGRVAYVNGILPSGGPTPSFNNSLVKANRMMFSHSFWCDVRHADHGMQEHQWAGEGVAFYQICYTSEARRENTINALYENAMNRLDSGAVIGEDLTYYDISQGDNMGYCTCRSCMKVYGEEGGAWSGAVVRWANLIDEELDDLGLEGLKYLIFAYHGTNIPCKTHTNDDVYVTLCYDGNCYRHSLDGTQCQWESFDMMNVWHPNTSLNNVDYAEWTRGWCDICDHVQIWYYAMGCNFHQISMLFPEWEDLRFMADCGVEYVYWDSAQNVGLGTMDLEAEMCMMFQMAPDMTRTEFREGLAHILEKKYGDGWQNVLELIDIWEEAEIRRMSCDNGWSYGITTDFNLMDYDYYYSNCDRITRLIDDALLEVNSKAQEDRLKKLVFTYLYTLCYAEYFKAYEAGDGETLEFLANLYRTAVDYAHDIGFNYHSVRSYDYHEVFDTIEETAWRVWIDDRAKYLHTVNELRPIPEEYSVSD